MAFNPPNTIGTTVEVSEIESLALGALIVGDGSGAPSQLSVGSNGAILQVLSSEATGMIWRTSPQLVDAIDWTTGVALDPDAYSILRNNDGVNRLQLNAPALSQIELSIQGSPIMVLASTTSTFNGDMFVTGDLDVDGTVTSSGFTLESGMITFTTSNAVTATSYQIGRDNEATNKLQLNVPTDSSIQFSVNGVVTAEINATRILTPSIGWLNAPGNALVDMADAGITLSRNVADANVAVIIRQVHASSTGSILELRNDTSTTLTAAQDGGITLAPEAQTSGVPDTLTITGAAHTGLTAATEDVGIYFNLSATKTWAAGAGPLATQREIRIAAPTYNGDVGGALTITDAATVYISGAPVQGTNITLSNTHALWVDAGNVRFDGTLNSTGGGALTGTWSDLGSVTTVDINGGTLDGVTIGSSVAGAITGTTITATSFVIGANTLTTTEWAFLDGQNQSVFTTSSPTFVNLTITSFAANWTNAGRTVADLGIVTTVDINGGTADGVTIGGSVAAAGTFTALVATSLDLNGALDLDVAALGATITNTADAASSQVMILEGDRATMVDNDEAYLTLRLSNDAGTQTEFARLTWVATDVNAATSVDGRIDFAVVTAGVLADELQLDGAALSPSVDGGLALGTTALSYSDLFLNTGATINWEGGDVTITHTANILTFAGGDVTFTNNLFTLNKSSAGIAQDINITATAYTTNVAAVDISRSGALTGVDTENILDVLIGPAFTLTEPASGSVNYIAFTVDLASVAVTAGAGDSETYAMRLVACSDVDAKQNLALWVDVGKVKLSGGGTDRQASAAGGLLEMGASTIQGNNASSTIAVGSAVSLGVTTFTNTAATLTMTDVASLYIAGIPVASTNVAFTNTALALWVDAGNVRFDGNILLPTSGSVINFVSGAVTITHSANTLTFAGATTGYAFNDGPITTGANSDINMAAGGRLYGGGIQANKQDLAANTNLTLDENDSVVNVTTGAVSANTITLPAASGNEGMIVSVYMVTDGGLDANVVRAGADVIQNGSADLANTQVALDDAGDFIMLQCVNSTMWQVLVSVGGQIT